MLHIIQNIKRVRKLTGMSQEAFAGKIGEKRSTYAEWESKIIPDLATLKKIADAAGVNLAELIGEPVGSDEKPDKKLTDLIEANKLHAEANKENAQANKTHADSINRMVRLLEKVNLNKSHFREKNGMSKKQ